MKLQRILSLGSCFFGGLLLAPAIGAAGLLGEAFATNVSVLYTLLIICLFILIGLGTLSPDTWVGENQSYFLVALLSLSLTLLIGFQPWL